MKSTHLDATNYLKELIAPVVTSLTGDDATSIEISRSNSRYGDFQTNIAMKLQKQTGKSPRETAVQIATEVDAGEFVDSAEVAGPGFVNITLKDDYWLTFLNQIDKRFLQEEYDKNAKVQVEFISANPTGPLTLGNARGGFIGATLSNVFNSRGIEAVREYYFNDAGTQIGKLVESYRAHVNSEVSEDTPYKGEYMKEIIANLPEIAEGGEGEALTAHIFDQYIKPALEKAHIEFDTFTNERIISRNFDTVYERLSSNGLTEEKDGALWLRSTRFGDERDRVLIKSNGDHTYLANDIAYHYDIYETRRFCKAIKVWGADHAGQIPSLKLTVNELFPGKELDFVIVQWVRLIKDGKEFKISKRAGTYVTVDELIDRVGADVARWFMLMRSSDTHMDFDLDLATEQSQKNPFWYVMYAYVRLCAILREAADHGIEPSESFDSFCDPSEREIVRHLQALPELLDQVVENYEVHKLTFYGHDLARIFHEWYEAVRVIELPKETASQRLFFLDKLKTVFDAYFELLDITPHEKM